MHVEHPQPERDYSAIDAMLSEADLPPPCMALARRIFRRLAEAEADVHGVSVDHVHFHEVGAVDSIVDTVAAAAGLTWLGARVACSPLPMGRGMIQSRHGVLPLPAPATLGCLRGVPTVAADIDAELVTPTGASVVATVATEFVRWPDIVPQHIGCGAGTRDLPDRPNVVRFVLGAELPVERRLAAGGGAHLVIEADLDDVEPELLAHACERLRDTGALDVAQSTRASRWLSVARSVSLVPARPFFM